jgi:hypothetical protein
MISAGEKGMNPGHQPGYGPNQACAESPKMSGE